MIQVYDDVMSIENNNKLYNEMLYHLPFKYGEYDGEEHKDFPTGVVADITDNFLYRNIFQSLVFRKCEYLKQAKLERVHVTLFSPNERPFFHHDGDVTGCLFYLTPKFDLDEGGETQFFIDGNITGILPKPARMIVFDGTILHRATSFRTKPRITVSVRYKK
jgi:hypothetical protein